MADWSQLPDDLLLSIARWLLPSLPDYVRFTAACGAWRSAALEHYRSCAPSLPPWLMLPHPGLGGRWTHGFLSLAEGSKTHTLGLPVDLERRACCGSSRGWLVMLDKRMTIHLLHPFSKQTVRLPPIPLSQIGNSTDRLGCLTYTRPGFPRLEWVNLHRWTFRKVVLSSDPTSSGCAVLLLLARTINQPVDVGFFRVGDESWTFLTDAATSNFQDAAFYCGRFYLLDLRGRLMVLGFESRGLHVVEIIQSPPEWPVSTYMVRMVESLGELLAVVTYDANSQDPGEFKMRINGVILPDTYKVFLLKSGRQGVQLVEVDGLGDRVLFLGNSCSASASSLNVPGCEGSSIYFFTTQYRLRDGGCLKSLKYELGNYSLADGITKSRPVCSGEWVQWPFCQRPVWVTPEPC